MTTSRSTAIYHSHYFTLRANKMKTCCLKLAIISSLLILSLVQVKCMTVFQRADELMNEIRVSSTVRK